MQKTPLPDDRDGLIAPVAGCCVSIIFSYKYTMKWDCGTVQKHKLLEFEIRDKSEN